jgi:hypothetical protein
MRKLLPAVGLVAALLGALFSVALKANVEAIPLVVLAFLLLTAVLLFVEARLVPVLAGVAVVLAAFSALLFYAPFVGSGKTYVADPPDFFHGPFESALLLVGWAAILLARQEDVEPTWVLGVGPLAAGLAILAMLFIPSKDFGTVGGANLVAAILCLALAVPMARLMGDGGDDEPAPVADPFAPSPTRPVPNGLKPAGPVKETPTLTAPVKTVPAKAPAEPVQKKKR